MTPRAKLTTGARLRSQVCTTELIVVRPPEGDVELTCGGLPMVPQADAGRFGDIGPEPGLNTGNLLGKRYASPYDEGFEALVTKAGLGTLADGRVPLGIKAAKALPASD